jgi:hypothetical protein
MKMNLSSLKPAAQPKVAARKAKQNNVSLLTKNEVRNNDDLLTKNNNRGRGRPAGTIKSVDKTMIGFRVTKSQQREIKQLALDLDTSVNDLLLRALEHYKQSLRVR